MQSQKLAPSIRDMLVSKSSDGGNIFDELPGQHTDYVSKLVSRMLMVILLTLPAPNFRCNFSRIYQTPWGWRREAQSMRQGPVLQPTNKVSLPRPFSLVCFCGGFRRRLCPMGAHICASPPPQTQSRLICGASPGPMC